MKPDRILLLSVPSVEQIRSLARGVAEGGVVCCLASGDQVHDLRSEVSDLRNVLVVPADPDGVIPWQDEFFTAVHAQDLAEAPAEALRVLAPGGVVQLRAGAVTKR